MTDTDQTTAAHCTCTVHHALTYAERARVATALAVARDQGDTDRVMYLGQQLEDCVTSRRPVVVTFPRPARISRRAWKFGGSR
jgi:serine protease inhibitor ecotin